MEEKRKSSVLPVLIIGISLILCSVILVTGLIIYKTQFGHTVTATGSASVDFESDLVVWRGSFSAHDDTSQAAYATIQQDAAQVKDYLLKNGVKEEEIVFGSVDISQNTLNSYDDNGNLTGSVSNGYDLTQSVTVTSKDIDTVEAVSRDISSLLS